MPELPEVEITARHLRAWGVGRRIEQVHADPTGKRLYRPLSPAEVAAALRRRRIERVDRKGKYLLITLADGEGRRATGKSPAPRRQAQAKEAGAGPGQAEGLVSHLGMTGKWVLRGPGEPAPRFARIRLDLDDGSALHYRDPRLFGRLRLVPGARFDRVPELARLGPDPLQEGIDAAWLAGRLARTGRAVKVAIMDQSLLPGVGNILASEACFRSRIDPRRPARTLARAEVGRLARAVLASIRQTIAREAGPEITYVEEPGALNPFAVYGKDGEPCPRCRRASIARVVLGQRSTFYCPRCQK